MPTAQVTIVFDERRTLGIPVEAQLAASAAGQARDWLDRQWEALGCEPLRISGKVLLLDKILGIADALGHAALASDGGQAREFARQVVVALGKPRVTIDLPALSVTS